MKEAKAKGLDVLSFYLASWNEMKEAKAKGVDVLKLKSIPKMRLKLMLDVTNTGKYT